MKTREKTIGTGRELLDGVLTDHMATTVTNHNNKEARMMQTTQPVGQGQRLATRTVSSLGAVLLAAALLPSAHADMTLSNVTSATAIDPPGGAAISYTDNPNFESWFKNYTPTSSSENFTPVGHGTMQAKSGVTILNFEDANGYGQATAALSAGGLIFTGTASVAPFSLADRITSINFTNGRSVAVDERILGGTANPAGGVFLVGDRALPADPEMVSATQGLVAGPLGDGGAGAGTFLTFSANVTDFSAVIGISNGAASRLYVALYDANNTLLAAYDGGFGNARIYFGVNSPNALIRSVWIGQNNGNNNGLVLDDVAFVAVPEPAAVCLLGLGGLLAFVRHGFGGQRRRTSML